MGLGIPARALSDLVLDASAAIDAAIPDDGFRFYGAHVLHGPGLMWWEVNSVLHEHAARGDIATATAEGAMHRVNAHPIRPWNSTPELLLAAVRVARLLGWTRVYDAVYVALALQIEGSRLVTLDERLRRGASRLVEIIGPAEI